MVFECTGEQRRKKESVQMENNTENILKTFETIFEGAILPMALLNPRGEIIKSNEILCRVLQKEQCELVEQSYTGFIHESSHGEINDGFARLSGNKGVHFHQTVLVVRDGGEPIPTVLHCLVFRGYLEHSRVILACLSPFILEGVKTEETGLDQQMTGKAIAERAFTELSDLQGLIRTIERKRFIDMMKQINYRDSLTGLPNRNGLMTRFKDEISFATKNGLKFAVLYVDLDRFNQINSTLGHSAGNALLQKAARRLQDTVEDEVFISRIHYDIFILLVSGINSREEVIPLLEKILDSMREVYNIFDNELFLTTSIGVAVYPDNGVEAEVLIKHSDYAMALVKEHGGNNYKFYERTIKKTTLDKFKLESYLYRALEKEEMRLYYQPQISLETCEMIGMEALIRWQQTEHGKISPLEFIPMAEHTGLIIPIGEWALRTACRQNRLWQDAGLPKLKVAVNFSARQFRDGALDTMVGRALEETGLRPEYLEIEITESDVMENPEQTIVLLYRLNALGIKIAIDDFGTGYSSLAYLTRFPIETLKIDQSFVRGVPNDAENAAIVATVCALAHSLRIRVVAEGVENNEQVSFLHALSCNEFQGYFYSPPLPADEMTEFIKKWKKISLSDFSAG